MRHRRQQSLSSEPQPTLAKSTSLDYHNEDLPSYQEEDVVLEDEKQLPSPTHEILLIPSEADWYHAIATSEPHPHPPHSEHTKSNSNPTFHPKDPISALLLATTRTVTGVLVGTADLTGLNPASQSGRSRARARGVPRILSAAIQAPRDYTLALAEGFRESPALYGDTIRPAPEITGFGSGMAAAGKGLGLGLFDGLSGVVLKPVAGAKTGGVVGCMKGVGKGIGGLVLNPCAGACGVAGYMLEGVHVECRKVAIKTRRLTRKREEMVEGDVKGFH